MPVKDTWVDGESYDAAAINSVGSSINDLETDVAGKAASVHAHAAGDVTSGTLDIARIPTGSSGSTVCIGNDSRLSNTRTPTDNTVSTAKIQDAAVTVAKLGADIGPAMQSVASRPRVLSSASEATLTVNVDNHDQAVLTAQAAALTIAAPTGTLFDGQKVLLRIKDNGTARAITWDAIFRIVGTDLPTTTVISKTLYVGVVYNAADSRWDVIAVGQEK